MGEGFVSQEMPSLSSESPGLLPGSEAHSPQFCIPAAGKEPALAASSTALWPTSKSFVQESKHSSTVVGADALRRGGGGGSVGWGIKSVSLQETGLLVVVLPGKHELGHSGWVHGNKGQRY